MEAKRQGKRHVVAAGFSLRMPKERRLKPEATIKKQKAKSKKQKDNAKSKTIKNIFRIWFVILIFDFWILHLFTVPSLMAEDYDGVKLPAGTLLIDSALKMEWLLHELKPGWQLRTDAKNPISKNYKLDIASSSSTPVRSDLGELLLVDVAARPTESIFLKSNLAFMANYADRFWRPINQVHRQEHDGNRFFMNSGEITYRVKNLNMRAYQGLLQHGWKDDGDMFGLVPNQHDVEYYLNFSGQPTPRAGEIAWKTRHGEFTVMGGAEPLWSYGPSVYAKYVKRRPKGKFSLFYADEEIPFGDPEEKRVSWQLSSMWERVPRYRVETALLYRPFRLRRQFGFVDRNGSTQQMFDKTRRQDAFAAKTKFTLNRAMFLRELAVAYTYAGLVAGNKHEGNIEASRRAGPYMDWNLGYTYREPLKGPLPFIYEGTPSLPGPILVQPRGRDEPFWVNWDNRKAHLVTVTFTFDPTPATWFYRYVPNLLTAPNVNPEEDAPFSLACQFRLAHYPTTTDRLYYYNEFGKLQWDPAGRSGAWATKNPVSSFSIIGKLYKRGMSALFYVNGGQSLALDSLAYTATTIENNPVIAFYETGIVFNAEPYEVRLKMGRNVWGPEDYHNQLGVSLDKVYSGGVTYKFNDFVSLGADYVGVRETDFRYMAPDVGAYDEYKMALNYRFGAQTVFKSKPQRDFNPPVLQLTLSSDSLYPEEEKLTMWPEAEDPQEAKPSRALVSDVSWWEISIVDAKGQLVKNYAGSGVPPETEEWDGVEPVTGNLAPPGVYAVSLAAGDRSGNIGKTHPARLSVVYKPKYIEVVPDENGKRVSINEAVLFDFNKWNLKPQSREALDELVSLILSELAEITGGEAQEAKHSRPLGLSSFRIRIEGHTDSVGSAAYNKRLSERRAEAVYDYLVEQGGIDPGRFKVVGYGESRPVASNDTREGRQQNRRVEIFLPEE